MKIPHDLKPGDRLWYSKDAYAIASTEYGTWMDGEIDAMVGDNFMSYYLDSGYEIHGDTPPIIRIERIERIASKAKKPDNDAVWLSMHLPYSKRRNQIIKRLNGGVMP